jgi:hypothetical protein
VPAQEGDTMQQIAAREGNAAGWQDMAEANDVEDPRHVPAGTLLSRL